MDNQPSPTLYPNQATLYPTPHWQNEPEQHRSPYLYKAGATLRIASGIWFVPDRHFPVNTVFYVKGSRNGTTVIEAEGQGTNVDLPVKGAYVSISDAPKKDDTSWSFPNNVQYFDPFRIDWEISVGEEIYQAGYSENPVYVCLKGPLQGQYPLRAIAHVACSVGDASTPEAAFANSWSLFTNQSLQLSYDSNRKLYYYQWGTTFQGNGIRRVPSDPRSLVVNVATLLKLGTGQCGAWQDLLIKAAALNNAVCERVRIEPISGYGGMLVSSWFDWRVPFSWLSEKWIIKFAGPGAEMVPAPGTLPPDVFGLVRNDFRGIVGQGSSESLHGCPSEKVFGLHLIVKYNGNYYDPSYGSTYTNEWAFQGNLYAITKQIGLYMFGGGPNPMVFELDQPNGLWIKPWP
ncbi:MAG: hypothetical protein WC740_16930 [Verrucomicrobiia bacterium]